MNTHTTQSSASRGYIALMSALILSALLLVLAITANADAFIARTNLTNEENHLHASHNAYTCGTIVLSILTRNPYRLSQPSPLEIRLRSGTVCRIISGTVTGDAAEGTVQAHYLNTVSRVYIRATRASSTAPFVPVYWSERSPEQNIEEI